jgi:hypothetical protein
LEAGTSYLQFLIYAQSQICPRGIACSTGYEEVRRVTFGSKNKKSLAAKRKATVKVKPVANRAKAGKG